MQSPRSLCSSPWSLALSVAFSLLVPLSMMTLGCAGQSAEESVTIEGVLVEVTPLRRDTIRSYVRTYGTVEPQPGAPGREPARAAVASPIEGIVAQAKAVEGQRVEKGATLFNLDARAVEATIDRAQVDLDHNRKTLERRQALISFDGTSQSLLEQAQYDVAAAEAQLDAARTERALLDIVAPLTGTVVSVLVRPGESVRRDTVLCEVVDLTRLVATMQVPAAEVAAIHSGQPATISSSQSGPSKLGSETSLTGEVTLVGSVADPRTSTVSVRVSLPADSGLVPGSLVDVRVVTEERADRLVVPVESLVAVDGETTILRLEGNTAVRVPVEVGLIDEDLAEIAGPGLAEGMEIVTVGAYGLPDGAVIRVQEGGTPR